MVQHLQTTDLISIKDNGPEAESYISLLFSTEEYEFNILCTDFVSPCPCLLVIHKSIMLGKFSQSIYKGLDPGKRLQIQATQAVTMAENGQI